MLPPYYVKGPSGREAQLTRPSKYNPIHVPFIRVLKREEREGLSPPVEKSGKEFLVIQRYLSGPRRTRPAQGLSPGSEAQNGAGFPNPTKPHKIPLLTTLPHG